MRRKLVAAGVGALLLAAAGGGCAPWRGAGAAPEVTPAEAFAGVLGRNPSLSSVRAEVEARFRYAGGSVSLPGVLLLDRLGGFRLELLDPLDRPLAIFFPEDGARLVQYRPPQGLAASLALFPASCRGVGAADWVGAVLASSAAPVAGERLAVRALWGGERVLERSREGQLRQSVRFERRGTELVPRLASWYCGDEIALQLRMRDWVTTPEWRLPTRLELDYPAAGLSATLELRSPEANPPVAGRSFRPRIGDEVRWTSWRLPR